MSSNKSSNESLPRIKVDPSKFVVNPISGAKRQSKKGLGRFDLIPAEALRELAKHYEAGAEEHGDRNWEAGLPLSVYYNSAQRHLLAYLDGDNTEKHLAALLWNVSCMIHHEVKLKNGELPQEFNDIPSRKEYLTPTNVSSNKKSNK